MSYDHKDLVQRESREILSSNGWVKVSGNSWVREDIAIRDYGYKPHNQDVIETKKSGLLSRIANSFFFIFNT